ncbi:hypothetical protein [Streptomyces sp. NPDC047014]|uniref:vWA-MoxR associated conflict system protein n=1 Tax=Streptomyces sp. NPDC047014 TaxID=3155736 RepID=UPI0033E4C514
MTEGRHRHVLVVGAQCASMPRLPRLESAARGLHSVLTHPDLGACAARTGAHPSLLISPALTPGAVRAAVHEAMRRAREDKAVLVLALLGHGFTTPAQQGLYYMTAESTTGSTLSALNVGQLLSEAVDEPGVEGVIALIDTCYAGAGLPDTGRIAGGLRAGRLRLSVVTAAASDQPARGMKLSRGLAHVLRSGVPGAGAVLYADERLLGALRPHTVGQAVGGFAFQNDPFAAEGLWLARNARRGAAGASGAVGPLGLGDLQQAVSLWRADTRLPLPLTRAELDSLYAFAREGEVDDEADPRWRARVVEVVGTLLVCSDTVTLLNEALAEVLTSDLLREARRLAGLPPAAEGPELLRDLVEYAALRAAGATGPAWQGLVRLVAALARQSGAEEAMPRLRAWATDLKAVTEFNDALAAFDRKDRQDGLRLVLSLAGALTDWPEEVDAWLVGTGERLPVHRRFPCRSADRLGTAETIGAALRWARGLLSGSAPLVNVDVAAPAHLLARWQPEEAKVGLRLLGVNHDIVVRWSGRLAPTAENAELAAEMNDAARRALRGMGGCATVPVEWIGASVLADPEELERALTTGRYDTAVGLDHHPDTLQDVLEQLLPYAPIILWPRPGARMGHGRLRALVQQHWHGLPAVLPAAYRKRWDVVHGECADCLGDVRAVWHDEAWLEFCRPFEERVVAAPEEEW